MNQFHQSTYLEKVSNNWRISFNESVLDSVTKIEKRMGGNSDKLLGDVIADELTKKQIRFSNSKKIYFDKNHEYLVWNEFYHLYHYLLSGNKIFQIEQNLVDLLLRTELNEIDSFFLKSPFRCIYLSIPTNNKILIPVDSSEVTGMYITLLEKDEFSLEDSDIIKVLSILVIGRANGIQNTIQYWTIQFKEGDIYLQLEKYFENNKYSDEERLFLEELFSFVINCLMYISSEKKDIQYFDIKEPENNHSKNIKSDLSNIKKNSYYSVGSSIIINPSDKKKYETNEGRFGRKITSKWIVRGHWRNQAYGKSLSQRKLVWIKPFVKGNDMSEILKKDYKVK